MWSSDEFSRKSILEMTRKYQRLLCRSPALTNARARRASLSKHLVGDRASAPEKRLPAYQEGNRGQRARFYRHSQWEEARASGPWPCMASALLPFAMMKKWKRWYFSNRQKQAQIQPLYPLSDYVRC